MSIHRYTMEDFAADLLDWVLNDEGQSLDECIPVARVLEGRDNSLIAIHEGNTSYTDEYKGVIHIFSVEDQERLSKLREFLGGRIALVDYEIRSKRETGKYYGLIYDWIPWSQLDTPVDNKEELFATLFPTMDTDVRKTVYDILKRRFSEGVGRIELGESHDIDVIIQARSSESHIYFYAIYRRGVEEPEIHAMFNRSIDPSRHYHASVVAINKRCLYVNREDVNNSIYDIIASSVEKGHIKMLNISDDAIYIPRDEVGYNIIILMKNYLQVRPYLENIDSRFDLALRERLKHKLAQGMGR